RASQHCLSHGGGRRTVGERARPGCLPARVNRTTKNVPVKCSQESSARIAALTLQILGRTENSCFQLILAMALTQEPNPSRESQWVRLAVKQLFIETVHHVHAILDAFLDSPNDRLSALAMLEHGNPTSQAGGFSRPPQQGQVELVDEPFVWRSGRCDSPI